MAAANMTVPSTTDVKAHVAAQPEARAADRRALIALMQRAGGHPPVMGGRLGKHRQGKGCVDVKRRADVDLGVLEGLGLMALWERRL